MFKLKATAVAVALAASGAAQAITIDNTDLVVNIVRNGLSGDSMVVNTNLNAQDVQSGAVSNYSSDPTLSSAIFDFIDGASDVQFWVAGRYISGFDNFLLSNKSFTNKTTVNAAVDSSIPNGFIGQANPLWFDASPNNYVAGIPAGDPVHFDDTNVFGNGIVSGTSLGDSAAFFWSKANILTPDASIGSLGNWSLDTTGELSYGVSAVPVPAAVWLFGSGLVGLVGVARRRQQK